MSGLNCFWPVIFSYFGKYLYCTCLSCRRMIQVLLAAISACVLWSMHAPSLLHQFLELPASGCHLPRLSVRTRKQWLGNTRVPIPGEGISSPHRSHPDGLRLLGSVLCLDPPVAFQGGGACSGFPYPPPKSPKPVSFPPELP